MLAISLGAGGRSTTSSLPCSTNCSSKPGDVVIDVPPTCRRCAADAILLQRAIVNLLTNALRYSPKGEPPRVSASAFGGKVEIRVTDSGPGVPDERKEEIFHPFQRMGDTDNTAGIGLGLALTKGFVEGMGGTLDAEDTPGGGLTMVLSLPHRRDRALGPRSEGMRDVKIVVADDDPQMLGALRIILSAHGYDVIARAQRQGSARRRRRRTGPTWSSSTSACRSSAAAR